MIRLTAEAAFLRLADRGHRVQPLRDTVHVLVSTLTGELTVAPLGRN